MSRISDAAGNAGEETAAMSEKAAQVGKNLRDLGSQARDLASDQYSQIRDSASEYYEQGKEKAREWESTVEQYIKEKPLQSVLIAAGVGVVLGLLWKRG